MLQLEPTDKPVLGMRDLVFSTEETTLIDGINLNLSPDQLTIVMGQNGAGKSLLLRLLHGLITPSSGQILWNGEPINRKIRESQAMVFQKPVLLRRSVAKNLDFVLQLCGQSSAGRRQELLQLVGLNDALDQPARSLSGGEQQRLSLACALATQPDVIFLDEPTASLDPASVLLIEKILIEEQHRGTKIIFVTHDLGQARRLAGEIVFLHRGQLEEQSSASMFFDRPRSPIARNYLAGKITL